MLLEKSSLDFIKDAVVDYSPDKFGGTLTIKAPNAKLPQLNENASIEEKINYVLYSEINPSLASHGGEVSLVEVVDKKTAVLQFGGGCQGWNDKIELNFDDCKDKLFYDLIYSRKTSFLKERENTNFIKNGMSMFIFQAQIAYESWFGYKPHIEDKLWELLSN